MMPEARRIEAAFGAALGIELRVAVAARRADPRELSPAEAERCRGLATPRRRDAWLRGRAALKALLRRCGESDDTARIAFPNPRFALTHSGACAVAIAAAAGRVRGIGVDLELDRVVDPRAARFFLDERELGWLRSLGPRATRRELLRLWTVKEAVFKADPGNAERILGSYRLASPAARRGTAFIGARSRPLSRYATVRLAGATLSAAVTPTEEPTP